MCGWACSSPRPSSRIAIFSNMCNIKYNIYPIFCAKRFLTLVLFIIFFCSRGSVRYINLALSPFECMLNILYHIVNSPSSNSQVHITGLWDKCKQVLCLKQMPHIKPSSFGSHWFDSPVSVQLVPSLLLYPANHNTLDTYHIPRPTQPPTPCGTGNEYRPKCGDALRMGSKMHNGSFHLWINVWVAGRTVRSLVNTCHTWAL